MGRATVCSLFLLFLFSTAISSRLDGIRWHFENVFHDENHKGKSLNLNDFESGSLSPWNEESVGDARWLIEDYNSPLEPDQPAPSPSSGSKYLRVQRPAGTSGQAVLRSSPFTVEPGDEFSFNFWIRSQIIQTNNLEVYWMNGTRQERILSLIQYSTPTNFEWRKASAIIPATGTSETKLSIFGFCNSGDVDAIAIDDLVVVASGQTLPPTSTSSLGPDLTTSSQFTTQSTASTPPSGTCPTNLGPNQMHCAVLGGKCYCFSLYKVSSWYEGDSYCKTYGSTLLNLETQAETSLIDGYITGGSAGLDRFAYWTSGQFTSGQGFTWTGSNQPFTYTNWYPGEPSNSAPGYCVRSFYGTDYAGRWSDVVCTGEGYVPFYFICEL